MWLSWLWKQLFVSGSTIEVKQKLFKQNILQSAYTSVIEPSLLQFRGAAAGPAGLALAGPLFYRLDFFNFSLLSLPITLHRFQCVHHHFQLHKRLWLPPLAVCYNLAWPLLNCCLHPCSWVLLLSCVTNSVIWFGTANFWAAKVTVWTYGSCQAISLTEWGYPLHWDQKFITTSNFVLGSQ